MVYKALHHQHQALCDENKILTDTETETERLREVIIIIIIIMITTRHLVREQEERLREVIEDNLEKARSSSLTWT